MRLGLRAALTLLFCILLPPASEAATEKVDTALVLAVDVSGSVDDR